MSLEYPVVVEPLSEADDCGRYDSDQWCSPCETDGLRTPQPEMATIAFALALRWNPLEFAPNDSDMIPALGSWR